MPPNDAWSNFFKPESMLKLHDALVLPATTKGFLDWPSGLIRVNHSVDEVRGWLDGSLEAKKKDDIEQLVFHEVFHFLQITTSAYLYFWVIKLHAILVQTLTQANIVTNIDEFITEVPAQIKPILKMHLNLMDKSAADGVTVRALVEGITFLAQSRRFAEVDMTAKGYFDYLAVHCPAEEYRKCFDVATAHMGLEAAFYFLPVLTSLSLSTSNPHESFGTLCKELGKRNILPRDGSIPAGEIQSTSNQVIRTWMGFPTDIIKKVPDRHPVYTDVAEEIAKSHHQEELSTFVYQPNAIDGQFWALGLSPIICNPNPSTVFKGNREWPVLFTRGGFRGEKGDPQASIGAGKLMLILSSRVIGNFMPYSEAK
jgi:hypothetical protein